MARVRAYARVAWLAVVLSACLVPFWLSGGAGKQAWFRRFLTAAFHISGARVRIVGTPLREHVLYAANHISWMDILVLGGATGTRFVAKSEIDGWPLIGTLARWGGTIFVERKSRGETRAQADTIAAALAAGRPITLFAEGGTGDGTVLLPFRASLFAAVQGSAARVQPVAIDYGARFGELVWPSGESPAANALKLFGKPGPLAVTLHFLAPLDATLDRKELARRAHAAVDAVLHGSYTPAP